MISFVGAPSPPDIGYQTGRMTDYYAHLDVHDLRDVVEAL